MTHAQMEDLRYAQIHNEVEMVPANRAKKLKDERFAKLYSEHEIGKHEQHIFHVALEMREFDRSTGRIMSQAKVAKFTVSNFESMKKQDAWKGYNIEIVHNPKLKKVVKEEKANPVMVASPQKEAPKKGKST